ncbi:MAG: hypothetical protein AAF740_02175, partial [Bacteroidota bacterium]
MTQTSTRKIIWLRAIRKYRKLAGQYDNTFKRISNSDKHKSLCRKLDILRRRILKMNRAWKLGIATASLVAWLNVPVLGQFSTPIEVSGLDGTDGFTINPIGTNYYTGRSVSNLGDLNGDGIDDVIVGAPYADPNGASSGQTYVVFGRTDFGATFEISDIDGTNGFILNGIDASDVSGGAVSGAGDVNGDGRVDLIIGARQSDPGGTNRGEVYVIFGQNSFPTTFEISDIDGTNGFILNGVDDSDLSGSSVSAGGDINGDGIDDFIIGAPEADPNGSRSGESYVIFGQMGFGASLDLSSLDGTNGFVLNGITGGDRSGGMVSNTGDVNGDGIDDLIIGARYGDPNGNNSGESYIVFGQTTFSASLNLASLDGTNGLVLNGIVGNDRSGIAVSGAGDVNNDGINDVIIGARDADPNGSRSGQSYVVFGQTNFGATFELSSLDGTNGFTLNGIDANDFSGVAVSGVGDVNDDGIDDFIIGATGADISGTSSGEGESYVVFGQTNFNATFELSALNGSNGFQINGTSARNYSGLGRSLSSAGDVNGDGITDILLGENGFYTSDSQAYVIFGQRNTTLPVTWTSFEGEVAEKQIKLSWSTVSEVNNSHFVIESSTDGYRYEEAGRVLGSGNAYTKQTYKWSDPRDYLQSRYYRLRQVDFEGTENLSKVIRVSVTENTDEPSIRVFPNPITNQPLQLRLNTPTDEVQLRLRAITGEQIGTILQLS